MLSRSSWLCLTVVAASAAIAERSPNEVAGCRQEEISISVVFLGYLHSFNATSVYCYQIYLSVLSGRGDEYAYP